MNENYDVAVVGGGAAGLSGAIALARSRRRVLVVDAGEPRNASADGVHNFLTRDGMPPAEIYATGRAELLGYGGHVAAGRVTELSREGDLFRVKFRAAASAQVSGQGAGEQSVTARRLLVATGLRDELPDVPGLAARWGIDVLHCPYCHGWEVRDKRVGILATHPDVVHQALLFRQLTEHVTVLRHTGGDFGAQRQEQLDALGIPVIDGIVEQVEAGPDPTGLTGVRLADGTRVTLDALVVAPLMRANAELLTPLGLEPAEVRVGEHVMGTQIEADPTGATKVPGVWVAGNAGAIQAQVITAAAAGLMAGAVINMDLVNEDARRAVQKIHTRCWPG
jgi:thioredoxin reductase